MGIATKTDLSANKWYTFDVSACVTKNGMYTFLLKTDTPGIIVGIYGKGTEYEPELIVHPHLPYAPWSGTVLCPGQSYSCDCQSDCYEHPEFCQCAEAGVCCD